MSRRYVTAERVRQVAAAMSPLQVGILRDVATARIINTRQLQRLHDVSGLSATRQFRRALASMVDKGLLGTLDRRIGGPAGAGSSPHIYRLDIAGQRWLELTGNGGRARRPWTPRPSFLEHALHVAELYVILRELERASDLELLHFQGEPDCWRRFADGYSTTILKPDAYTVTATRDYEDRFFIEVDLSTESTPTLNRKLDVYGRYWQSGTEQRSTGVFPFVLWFVPDGHRLAVLTDVISRRPTSEQLLHRATTFDSAAALLLGAPP